MRAAGILTILGLAMACSGQPAPGQVAVMAAAQPAPPAAMKRMDLGAIPKIEGGFEQRLRDLDPNDPFERLGACSGVYLDGYGVVFTTALSLVSTPKVSPFTPVITRASADAVHKRKLAHLPVLKKAMSEMLVGAARSLDALSPNDKVVVAVRLFYMDYEDKSGLPNQIVMMADRASALAGNIRTEER